ncbi:hypothetical protein [Pseudomonas sp. 18173]|uniref:hypothetical protein n=1 Tax=Pseudomonas sp. 18173 TaxID=3390055 RepID=UPI003D21EA89
MEGVTLSQESEALLDRSERRFIGMFVQLQFVKQVIDQVYALAQFVARGGPPPYVNYQLSLLAKAVCQAPWMLNVPASSRASSLLQRHLRIDSIFPSCAVFCWSKSV